MAKKDTHLTQTGAEVQRILDGAQRVYNCLPSDVKQPDEGDICVVTEGYHRISIRPADGATSFAFTVASKRVKWEVSEDYDLSDGTIASLTCQSSASERTTYIIPSPSSRTGEVTAFSDAFTLQWVSDKAADLKYITLYGYYEAGVFEYVNGAWVKRGDVNEKEDVANKVTSLSDQSNDTEYPSAKAVYDAIRDAATAGMAYDSITESIVVEPPHGSYDQSTETITL